MGMYPSGNIELMKVEDEHISIKIYGKNLDVLTLNRKLNLNTPAFIDVISKTKVNIKVKQRHDGLVNISGNQMFPIFFENGLYDFVIESNIYEDLSFFLNGVNINQNFKKIKND